MVNLQEEQMDFIKQIGTLDTIDFCCPTTDVFLHSAKLSMDEEIKTRGIPVYMIDFSSLEDACQFFNLVGKVESIRLKTVDDDFNPIEDVEGGIQGSFRVLDNHGGKRLINTLKDPNVRISYHLCNQRISNKQEESQIINRFIMVKVNHVSG